MRRWLRRRRSWLMHGPATVGGASRGWLWWLLLVLLTAAAGLGWVALQRQGQEVQAEYSQLQQAYASLQREHAQAQEALSRAHSRGAELAALLQAQRDTVSQAQALTSTVQSQSLADQAAQQELARQLRVLQQDNVRLKKDLSFFQSAIPKGGMKNGLALRSFEAQRLAPTQLHWQALVMQAVKNPQAWQGELQLVVSGTLNGEPWTHSPESGAVTVNLVQYVRLEGLVNIPAEAVVQTVSAKLARDKRVLAVQSFKF